MALNCDLLFYFSILISWLKYFLFISINLYRFYSYFYCSSYNSYSCIFTSSFHYWNCDQVKKFHGQKEHYFWWLPSSVSFYQYLMYYGLPPCNYKIFRANLPSHWSIPVLYRTLNFLVCTLLSVTINRTIIIVNFIYTIFNIITLILIIFLSLSHVISLNILFIGLSI